MNANFFHEPELEFGTGRHIDIKFGLMNYGPLDFESTLAPKRIRLGIVGTPETIEGVSKWIEKCRSGIVAKPSKRPNLFPRFPGFGPDMNLSADFVLDNSLYRSIPARRFDEICRGQRTDEKTIELADLFFSELEYLTQKTSIDVLVCAYPFSLVEFIDQQIENEDSDSSDEDGSANLPRLNLHDYLKAKAMRLRKPTQIIRPGTYDEKKRLSRKHPSGGTRQTQDEATRAWNLYTALYYKAGGVPWRLVREPSDYNTCYVGISFYKTLAQDRLMTSTAQIFNERGEGMILRGNAVKLQKDDRQIHLEAEDAHKLMKRALDVYRQEHRHYPARVVVHKSSVHNTAEIDGFEQALIACSIEPEQANFVSLSEAHTRLFRPSIYPPLRGTMMETSEQQFILYTKGSVDFFTTYPGLYVPRPVQVRLDKVNETASSIAQEILALTKMNWNNTQFDGAAPITLRAARQVGNILKHIDDNYEPYYRFYM